MASRPSRSSEHGGQNLDHISRRVSSALRYNEKRVNFNIGDDGFTDAAQVAKYARCPIDKLEVLAAQSEDRAGMPRFEFIRDGEHAYIRAKAGHGENVRVVAEKLDWPPETCIAERRRRQQTQQPEQGMGAMGGRSGPRAGSPVVPPPASCPPPQVVVSVSSSQVPGAQSAGIEELRMLATTRQHHVHHLQHQLQEKDVLIQELRVRVLQLESRLQRHEPEQSSDQRHEPEQSSDVLDL
eukprot:5107230-Amphidinium_carterae.2